MIPTDPFTALATLAINALPWVADKIAGHLLGEGADASASQVKRWANNRETQEQLHAAIEVALAKTRREARFSDFDQLFYPESLARDVVRVALTPHLLAESDYDETLRRSRQLTADREHARVALEFFFGVFRHQWEEQTTFAALRHDYETTLTHLQVQEIAQTIDETLKEFGAVQRRLETGIPTFPITPRPPGPDLVRAYLEEVAKQKPYVLWSDQTYIARTVAKTEDLFARTVARYDLRASERERKAKPEQLEAALAREGKLVLLGEPGLGKTTSLVHLAWDAANRALAKPPAGLEPTGGSPEIPIYVELKYYTGEAELETLLARRVNEILRPRNLSLAPDMAESARRLKAWLAQSDVHFLLLLDGLNEVRPEFYTPMRGILQALLNFPHHIVISCRERDYDESLRDRAAAFVLQGLQENEIRNYLRRVLGDRGVKLFDAQIRWDEKMRTLAANPLMLWLISVVAQDDPEARLPANRGKSFQQFVAMMPHLRAREVPANVPSDVVVTALAKLGFEMQERGRLAVDLGEVRGWQIPTAGRNLEDVLAQAKDWRFLKADGRLGEPVEFLLSLFLEYFAAEYLQQQLEAQLDYSNVLGMRPLSGQWDEVIVMLAGIHDQSAELVKWLAAQVVERQHGRVAFIAQRCWETSKAAESTELRAVVVDALIAALRDPDRDVREHALTTLLAIDPLRAVEPLIVALCDPDQYVRSSSASFLGAIGDLRALGPLTAALYDPDYVVRWSAADALGKIGDSRAVEPLIAALCDPDKSVRGSAARALGVIGDRRAVESLITLLRDSDEETRWYVAGALGKIGDPRAIEPLIDVLRNPDEDVQWRVVPRVQLELKGGLDVVESLVATVSDPHIIEPLLDTLPSRKGGVRWSAAHALVQIGTPAVEPLIAELCNPHPVMRWRAADILGEIGDLRAVEPLIAALLDPKPEVRWLAAEALRKISDAHALLALECVAQEDKGETEWGSVADAAREAVREIQLRQQPIEEIIVASQSEDAATHRIAVAVLREIYGKRIIKPLIADLRNQDVGLRIHAAFTLGQIGDLRVLPELERVAREDKNWLVADAAQEAAEEIRKRIAGGGGAS